MTERRKRRYSSPLRRESADATQARIVEAAREVMLERGYVATTMADVAARAGVAVPTLYAASPGGKPALARTVFDVTLAGDAQPIPQHARPAVAAIIAEPDPVRKVEAFAAMATGINSRIEPVDRIMRAAAAADPDAEALIVRAEQQRLTGSRGPVEHLAETGHLRPDLPVDDAVAQVFVLTAPAILGWYTRFCGWDTERYQRWLARTLITTLLPEEESG